MDNIKFGKFIREMRREQGMTQKQLAEKLYVSDKAVSKWENGLGFPDIKLLENLAENLGVSVLELMQSQRMEQEEIPARKADELLKDAMEETRKEKERRQQLWLVKLLLAVSVCGVVFLLYENSSPVSLWIGGLSLLCAAAALWFLKKADKLRRINTGKHRMKNLLTVLMDLLVVMLLHTFLSYMANNEEQLRILPEAVAVNAYISNKEGSQWEGIDISDEVVQGLLDSRHVKNLHAEVRMKAGFVKEGEMPAHDAMTEANLFLLGLNHIDALSGLKTEDIVWDKGMDETIFAGSERKCVVTKEVMDNYAWELGQDIDLTEFYYVRLGTYGTELGMEPLADETWQIAGYVDLRDVVLQTEFSVDLFVPFACIRNTHHENHKLFQAHAVSFEVKNPLLLNEFKQEMKDLGLTSVSPISTEIQNGYNGTALVVSDSVFISAATHLRRMIDMSKLFFPAILVLIVGVGYLATLLLLQSRKKEMALLRSLGYQRRQCFGTYFAEQMMLVVVGVAMGNVLAVLLQGNYGVRSVLAGVAVGICYMAGNSLALWKLLKISVMEALSLSE